MATSDAQALLLTVSADTSKALKAIDALNKRLSDAGPELERRGKKAAEGLEKGLGSINVGKALDKVFDSSKLAVLEEGSARLRIFGSALEPLGPLGIGAAAGIAAFGIALEEAHKAMEYAEQVQHLAEVLGTTTDKVQELNYASVASGVNFDTAKQAAEELQVSIAKYAANIGDKRLIPVFDALGITKESARDIKDPVSALSEIGERLEKIRNTGQRNMLAEKLGIPKDIVPVLGEIGEKMKEAKASGAVIDAGSIKKAADLNKELAATKDIISVQLKEAFITLAPVVKTIADMMAGMAKDANLWLQNMINGGKLSGQPHYDLMTEDVLRTNQTDKALQLLQGRRELSRQGVKFDARGNIAYAPPETTKETPNFDETGASAGNSALTVADYNTAKADYDAMTKALGAKIAADRKPASDGTGGGIPLAPEVVKALPKDDSGAKLEGAQATLIGAQQKLAEAYQKLSGSLDEAYQNQRKAIDLGADKQIAEIEKQKTELQTSDNAKLAELAKLHTAAADAEAKNIQANHDKTIAVLNQTETEVRLTQSTDLLLAEREHQLAQMTLAAQLEQDSYQQRLTAYQNEAATLTLRASLATVAKDRVDLERAALVAQQKADSELAASKLAEAKSHLEAVKATSPDDKDAIKHAQNAVDAAQTNVNFVKAEQPLQTASFEKANAGPLQQYINKIQDLNTAFQEDGVQAIQALNSGLVDAALHAKNLGDVLKNTFLNLVQQILTQTLEREAAPGMAQGFAALLHFIPGFASGTDFAPGGMALVGEKGPELVNLPRGASVTPTFQTLDAINAMKAPQTAPAMIAGPTFVLNSPVMTQDLLDQMNSISAAHARQAAQVGRSLAVQDVHRAGYLGGLNQ
jgi:hypothetical protein